MLCIGEGGSLYEHVLLWSFADRPDEHNNYDNGYRCEEAPSKKDKVDLKQINMMIRSILIEDVH